MTAAQIQEIILTEAGLKTSVKVYKSGSMNGYVRIMPIFQDGRYPSLPIALVQKLKTLLSDFDYSNKPLYCSCSDVCVYQIVDDRLQMKKESKPKEIDENKISKGWGSKNSQMRLDKASKRAAKLSLWQKQ
jgi:hypothetical protein